VTASRSSAPHPDPAWWGPPGRQGPGRWPDRLLAGRRRQRRHERLRRDAAV